MDNLLFSRAGSNTLSSLLGLSSMIFSSLTTIIVLKIKWYKYRPEYILDLFHHVLGKEQYKKKREEILLKSL